MKQLLSDIEQKSELSYHLIFGERILSVMAGVVSSSVEKLLDFHDTTFSVSPSPFKVFESD